MKVFIINKKSQPYDLQLLPLAHKLLSTLEGQTSEKMRSFLRKFFWELHLNYNLQTWYCRYSLLKWFTHDTPTYSDLIWVSRPHKPKLSCQLTFSVRQDCPPLDTYKDRLFSHQKFHSSGYLFSTKSSWMKTFHRSGQMNTIIWIYIVDYQLPVVAVWWLYWDSQSIYHNRPHHRVQLIWCCLLIPHNPDKRQTYSWYIFEIV